MAPSFTIFTIFWVSLSILKMVTKSLRVSEYSSCPGLFAFGSSVDSSVDDIYTKLIHTSMTQKPKLRFIDDSVTKR